MKSKSQTKVSRLKKRGDFVRLQHKGNAHHATHFVMQVMPNGLSNDIRLGFTASKKVGGAVQRNKAKRRMRAITDELMRLNGAFYSPQALDINMIARESILTAEMDVLRADLRKILAELACVIS